MRHRRSLLPALAVALLAASCGRSSQAAPPPATAPPAQPTTTTPATAPSPTVPGTTVPATTTPKTAPATTVPNPDAIPAQITPAYINAVFSVLNHIYGSVSRLDISTDNVPPESVAYLRAIFNDPLYAQELAVASKSLTTDLTNVRRPPGDRLTTVVKLLGVSSSCIFAQTTTDYSQVLKVAPAFHGSEYYELQPKQAGSDPNGLNPTPWAIAFNVSFTTPTKFPDKCAG